MRAQQTQSEIQGEFYCKMRWYLGISWKLLSTVCFLSPSIICGIHQLVIFFRPSMVTHRGRGQLANVHIPRPVSKDETFDTAPDVTVCFCATVSHQWHLGGLGKNKGWHNKVPSEAKSFKQKYSLGGIHMKSANDTVACYSVEMILMKWDWQIMSDSY